MIHTSQQMSNLTLQHVFRSGVTLTKVAQDQNLEIPARVDRVKLVRWVAAQIADVLLHEREHRRQYQEMYNPYTANPADFKLLADLDDQQRSRLEGLAEDAQKQINVSDFIDSNITSNDDSPSTVPPSEVLMAAVSIMNSIGGGEHLGVTDIVAMQLPENVAGQVTMTQPNGEQIVSIRSLQNPNMAYDVTNKEAPKLQVDVFKIFEQFNSMLRDVDVQPANVQSGGAKEDPESLRQQQISLAPGDTTIPYSADNTVGGRETVSTWPGVEAR